MQGPLSNSCDEENVEGQMDRQTDGWMAFQLYIVDYDVQNRFHSAINGYYGYRVQ